MYADDTSLCYQTADLNSLNESINSDFMQLDTWLKGNKLSLNVAKTNCMLIATKQKHSYLKIRNEDLHLTIRNKELEVIKNDKYLGVVIDNSLNWKEHIKTNSARVSKAIGFLRHAKAFLPQGTIKALYTGIVEPHFQYCCSVWGCAGSTEINQLQKLKHRAARILTISGFGTPSRLLVDMLGYKTIEQLIADESKIMVFKSLHDRAPPYLCDFFTRNSNSSSYVLRNNATDLKFPKKKSCNGQRCFSYRGVKMWNDLPEKTKQASSLYCFKKIFSLFSLFLLIFIAFYNSILLYS